MCVLGARHLLPGNLNLLKLPVHYQRFRSLQVYSVASFPSPRNRNNHSVTVVLFVVFLVHRLD